MSHASSLSLKIKRNIKSRKIDKRKRKMLVSKVFHNIFLQHHNNSIEFWKCPSHLNWSLHKVVNKETKAFNPTLLFPSKTSWNFSKKNECDDILNV